jgi:hypothetical protein
MNFTAILFFCLTITLVIFAFQFQDNCRIRRDEVSLDQDRVQEAARLLLESVTTDHPFLKLTNIIESKIIMDELIKRHHGPLQAESRLGLEGRHEFQKLRKEIDTYHSHVIDGFMQVVVGNHPAFNFEFNELAGLTRPRKQQTIAKASTISSHG